MTLIPLATLHPAWRGSVIPDHFDALKKGMSARSQVLSGAPFLLLGLSRLYSGVDEFSESLFLGVAGESPEASASMAERAIGQFEEIGMSFPSCSKEHPWVSIPTDTQQSHFKTEDTESIQCVYRTRRVIEAFPVYEVLELQLEVLQVSMLDEKSSLWNALFDYCKEQNVWEGFLCNRTTFPCSPTPTASKKRTLLRQFLESGRSILSPR